MAAALDPRTLVGKSAAFTNASIGRPSQDEHPPLPESEPSGPLSRAARPPNGRLQPLGIEAALAAQAAHSHANEDKRGQVELALEQASDEVGRARRQSDAVDTENRLVAAELEK
ncbi:hypothetical protein [Bradyrhizobium canariense]|uniref:hypothetical protein n=1 Tax=Bradyrhizobium canariense TaxID=255045 RepID=UPI0011788F5E|nr:hypothetical protein [Bradyrhizobium canariense]